MEPDIPLHIYIVSDATGKTGWRVVEAALLQFDASNIVVERVGGVQDEAGVHAAMAQAEKTRGLVIHTLVSPSLRRAILEGGRQRGIITIDLLGPVLTRLTEALQISPRAVPGLFRQLDDEYFARIDAIEYTVNHDDGRNPEQLDRADLVLVGVSRTGKTPLSVFLAYRGWRVANVPVVLGIDPPPELFRLDPRRVVALTIDRERLRSIRRVRAIGLAKGLAMQYAARKHIDEEMEWFRRVLRHGVWPVVDVTYRSIEETASEVMEMVRPRHGPDQDAEFAAWTNG
ncbi:MAG: kinase/pyrophosphorylase [Planctomycetes bacterium]|nr:kinase/pyrophosphorylase [Planctomycetota bacterium]